jgi:hypothetical protein
VELLRDLRAGDKPVAAQLFFIVVHVISRIQRGKVTTAHFFATALRYRL